MTIGPAPDWTEVTWMIGNYEGTPTLIAVDGDGKMIGVMYGTEDGTLHPIAVDAAGRIISVIRDPTSDNYIAVDSSGRLVAVIKGMHDSTPTDVAVDTAGRMIMIPTDPADVWGNAISMGNAELVARLTGMGGYDRRGNALLCDDFEGGLSKGLKTSYGTGKEVKLSSLTARSGSLSLKLVPGSEADSWAGYWYYLPYPFFKKVGLEAAFTVDTETAHFELFFRLYDGTYYYEAAIRYDETNKRVLYYQEPGTWVELIANTPLYKDDANFHVMKMILNLEDMTYHRVLLDSWSWVTGGLDMYTTEDTISKRIYFAVTHYGNTGHNPVSYVDSVIITQNEPG